jgi:protein-S-isoprenylcysteine O-methyltransferase Ste14
VRGLALGLLVGFGLVAGVLRVVVQLILTGSTGVRGISGGAGAVGWLAGSLLRLGIGLSVIGAVYDEAGGSGFVHVLGAVVAIAGLAATAGSQLAMGREWRIGVDPAERTHLVTGGPFALVRNPIYDGMVLFLAGIALLVPNVLTVAGALLLVAGVEVQARFVEEPHLRREHRPAYADYAARVGRFLPGVGRVRR